MNREQSNIITSEIQELSPTVAKIGRKNPFRVPEGFFTSTVDAMGFGVSASETLALSAGLASLKGSNPFLMPQGYMSEMELSLKEGLLAQDADPVLSKQLMTLKTTSPFKTPASYFENLTERLLDSRGSKVLTKGSSFKVPTGYFESLPSRVLDSVKEEEAKGTGGAAPKVIEMQPSPGQSSGGGLRRILTAVTSVAAILAILFIGRNFMTSVGTIDPNNQIASNDPRDPDPAIMSSMAQLSDEEIFQFLEDADVDLEAANLGDMIRLDDFSGVSDFEDAILQEYLLQELDLKDVNDLYL